MASPQASASAYKYEEEEKDGNPPLEDLNKDKRGFFFRMFSFLWPSKSRAASASPSLAVLQTGSMRQKGEKARAPLERLGSVSVSSGSGKKVPPSMFDYILLENIGGYSCHMDSSILLFTQVLFYSYKHNDGRFKTQAALRMWDIIRTGHRREQIHKHLLDDVLKVEPRWSSSRESVRNLLGHLEEDISKFIGFDKITMKMPDGTQVPSPTTSFLVVSDSPGVTLQEQINRHFGMLPHQLVGPRPFLLLITGRDFQRNNFSEFLCLDVWDNENGEPRQQMYFFVGAGHTPPGMIGSPHFVATVKIKGEGLVTVDGIKPLFHREGFAQMGHRLDGVRVDCWLYRQVQTTEEAEAENRLDDELYFKAEKVLNEEKAEIKRKKEEEEARQQELSRQESLRRLEEQERRGEQERQEAFRQQAGAVHFYNNEPVQQAASARQSKASYQQQQPEHLSQQRAQQQHSSAPQPHSQEGNWRYAGHHQSTGLYPQVASATAGPRGSNGSGRHSGETSPRSPQPAAPGFSTNSAGGTILEVKPVPVPGQSGAGSTRNSADRTEAAEQRNSADRVAGGGVGTHNVWRVAGVDRDE